MTTDNMEKNSKIYVAGHRGLAGSAIVRCLKKNGFNNLITHTHGELDLLDQKAVAKFFATEKPEYVFSAAAKVGGILANDTFPADFLYQNLQIQNNIIHQAYLGGVKKLLFLGSSCIYPKNCPQPIKEKYLLTGLLEETNEPYAIAKIAGIKLCQSYNRQYRTNFIAAMPTNLYGPYDNFNLETAHLFGALVRKFSEAIKSGSGVVDVWGTGKPRREFIHADEMAEACLFLMNNFNPTKEQNERGEIFLNIGVGADVTVKELVNLFIQVTGFKGKIVWDKTKPDGIRQKLLDVSLLAKLGWKSRLALADGIRETLEWYKNQNP